MPLIYRFLLLCVYFCCILNASSQPGQSRSVAADNRFLCPPHATLIPFDQAREGDILAIASSNRVQMLNDHWTYHDLDLLDPGEEAYVNPDFNDASWQSISWDEELPKRHADTTISSKVYRKTFTIKPSWNNLHPFIRFAGIQTDFVLWVNGALVGESKGRDFAEFDLGQFLQTDVNTLVIKTESSSKKTHPEAALFRDVFLVGRPDLFVEDIYTTTLLGKKFQTGRITLELTVAQKGEKNQRQFWVRSTLRDPDGTVLFSHRRKVKDRRSNRLAWKTSYPVNRPQLWTAETPHLYQLTIELLDKKGRMLEAVSQNVGFRQVKIEEGQLRINGKLIQIQGIEFDELAGQHRGGLSLDSMEHEIQLMKFHHVNAIRNLPADPRWYALCDQMGLYVINDLDLDSQVSFKKMDIEVSGRLETDSYLEAATSMVKQYRNHSSVIAWSLGEGNSDAELWQKFLFRVKALDSSRPVCHQYSSRADMNSEGYDLISMEGNAQTSPRIVWALGEQEGGFQRKWMQLDSTRGFQGAFIGRWNRIDQVDLLAAKYLWQPVNFIWTPDNPSLLTLLNQQYFASLTEGELRWKVLEDGQVRKSGKLKPGRIAAQSSKQFSIRELENLILHPAKEYYFEVSLYRKVVGSKEAISGEFAWEQWQWQQNKKHTVDSKPPKDSALPFEVFESAASVEVKVGALRLSFDKGRLMWQSLDLAERELLRQSPRPSLRATLADASREKPTELPFILEKVKVDQPNQQSVVITYQGHLKLGKQKWPHHIEYLVNHEARIKVSHLYHPSPGLTQSHQIGAAMVLPVGVAELTWYGLGPESSYQRENLGCRMGVFEDAVGSASNGASFDCQNHAETRWVELTDMEGFGIKIHGPAPFDFCLSPDTSRPSQRANSIAESGLHLYLGASHSHPKNGTTAVGTPDSSPQIESQSRIFSYEIQPLFPSNKHQ